MAKRKRGAPRRNEEEKPSEFEDRSASKLKIKSYEDVADSEDEYLFNRDQILLDEPRSKRNKRHQEEADFLQHSDEEVLGYSESSSDDEAEEDPDDMQDAVRSGDDEVDGQSGSEDEMAAWGSSKAAYYNTDKITNEEEALAEEQEARRLQQKRLKSLREADFGFDEGEWAVGEDEQEEAQDQKDGVVHEKLPQLQITPGMSDADKLKLLRRRYPEFEGFAKIMVELQPVWDHLKKDFDEAKADAASATPRAAVTQFRALSAYLGALAMYFAMLTSPAREGNASATSTPLPPQELKEHDVIEYVHRCKESWEDVIDLDDITMSQNGSEIAAEEDEFDGIGDTTMLENVASPPMNGVNGISHGEGGTEKQKTKDDARIAASEARRAARRAKIAASLDETSAQLARPVKASRKQRAAANDDYDLADEAPLDEREAAEKAQRKKSLRFYTSRIAQKANKDARFAEGAGGDDDLPYKERFRDKVERLNRAAEARGRKGAGGDELRDNDAGEDSGEELTNVDREAMSDDDDYKALMGQTTGKKEKKRQRESAYQEAKALGAQVQRVPQQEIGPGGRRDIGFQILKNKGLTPKRKKDVKNPRVKKRRRFEDKTKKLRTMRPTYKGGEGRGGYGGELTGIKTGLVKSTKL